MSEAKLLKLLRKYKPPLTDGDIDVIVKATMEIFKEGSVPKGSAPTAEEGSLIA